MSGKAADTIDGAEDNGEHAGDEHVLLDVLGHEGDIGSSG